MTMSVGELAARLGRRHAPDDRDRAYPLRPMLAAPPPERRWRYWWPNGWWGDQGDTPRCVSYAWLHWVEDGPVTHPYDATVPSLPPRELYDRAQRRDEWPGTNYDGTSVRAGAKVLRDEGLIESYRWAWDVETVVQALLTAGPVVVGTWWWTEMFQPDQDGFVQARGTREGGHAYVLNGVNLDRGVVRLKNSWGRWWGRRGHAWLTLDDLDTLISEQGEACLAIELTRRAA